MLMIKKVRETEYSRWLDEYFERTGNTSYALSPVCGVPQPTIDRIRSGKTKTPDRRTIKKLESVIDTPSPDSKKRSGLKMVSNNDKPVSLPLDRKTLEVTIRYLDEQVKDWRLKDASFLAGLIASFYGEVGKDDKATGDTTK